MPTSVSSVRSDGSFNEDKCQFDEEHQKYMEELEASMRSASFVESEYCPFRGATTPETSI